MNIKTRKILDYNDFANIINQKIEYFNNLGISNNAISYENLYKDTLAEARKILETSTNIEAEWVFVMGEPRSTINYSTPTHHYYGWKCSHCQHGYAGIAIPIEEENGNLPTEQEVHVMTDDMRFPFCPDCGVYMINGNQTDWYMVIFDDKK